MLYFWLIDEVHPTIFYQYKGTSKNFRKKLDYRAVRFSNLGVIIVIKFDSNRLSNSLSVLFFENPNAEGAKATALYHKTNWNVETYKNKL